MNSKQLSVNSDQLKYFRPLRHAQGGLWSIGRCVLNLSKGGLLSLLNMRAFTLTLLFLSITAITAACGVIGGSVQYGGQDVTAPFRNESTAFVVCGEDCLAQGQCGSTTTSDREVQVVLVNPEAPATLNHGGIIEANQPVTLLESRVQPMVVPASGERYQMTFYRVRHVQENGAQTEGWTHGMCVATRALN